MSIDLTILSENYYGQDVHITFTADTGLIIQDFGIVTINAPLDNDYYYGEYTITPVGYDISYSMVIRRPYDKVILYMVDDILKVYNIEFGQVLSFIDLSEMGLTQVKSLYFDETHIYFFINSFVNEYDRLLKYEVVSYYPITIGELISETIINHNLDFYGNHKPYNNFYRVTNELDIYSWLFAPSTLFTGSTEGVDITPEPNFISTNSIFEPKINDDNDSLVCFYYDYISDSSSIRQYSLPLVSSSSYDFELEYNLSGFTTIDSIVGSFIYNWGDGNEISYVKPNGDIESFRNSLDGSSEQNLRHTINEPDGDIRLFNFIKNNIGNNNFKLVVPPPPPPPPISEVFYLSALTTGNIIKFETVNLTNGYTGETFNFGDIVSGYTYSKWGKNNPLIIDGVIHKNTETKFKVITQDEVIGTWPDIYYYGVGSDYETATSTKITAPPYKDYNGNDLPYNFTVIYDENPETVVPFTGTIKIWVDIANDVLTTYSETEIMDYLNLITARMETLSERMGTDYTFTLDYEIWTDNTLDNKSIIQYHNFIRDNYNNPWNYRQHHYCFLSSLYNQSSQAYFSGNVGFLRASQAFDNIYSGAGTFIHELGHSLGMIHSFVYFWSGYFEDLNTPYLENSSSSITYFGECCNYCDIQQPFLDEFLNTDNEGMVSIMGYKSFPYSFCNTPYYIGSQLDPNYRYYQENPIYDTYTPATTIPYPDVIGKKITLVLYDFLDDNEFNNGSVLIISVQYRTIVSSEGIQNSIKLISLVEGNDNTYTLMGPEENISTSSVVTKNINFSDIQDIFDYNNQSKFGIEIERENVSSYSTDGPNLTMAENTISISFTFNDGSNNIVKYPKDFYSIAPDGTQRKMETILGRRAYSYTSYEREIAELNINYFKNSYLNLS